MANVSPNELLYVSHVTRKLEAKPTSKHAWATTMLKGFTPRTSSPFAVALMHAKRLSSGTGD